MFVWWPSSVTSPYAAFTVCDFVSLLKIPAVALLVYILLASPLSFPLSRLPFSCLVSPPPQRLPTSFSFSEIKRLLTSSRLMEPFFSHNGILGTTLSSAVPRNALKNNAQMYETNRCHIASVVNIPRVPCALPISSGCFSLVSFQVG